MEDKDLIRSRVYCCFKCRNVIALHDDIVNKYFLAGNEGRAFLISRLINIVEGPASDRHLTTGVHFVKDVFCSDCREYLGWKYKKVYQEWQKYKETKFAISKRKICKLVDAPNHL
ncbi:hypothetical protein DCAR_0205976 [Daucus carota subsp. sativus]|uniref:Protein yippee-like n=1 Tax=Daucus carota subsp. sativus TaxID=79200 RepID=A0A166CY58_DAUCS|nr:PREDICTED: protein yippee-like At4g27745 [Daucus carota subsp. sativus]WOG86758.1 hypothetical protein DCAR_0205976 [Daucus carota subsp. sativus]